MTKKLQNIEAKLVGKLTKGSNYTIKCKFFDDGPVHEGTFVIEGSSPPEYIQFIGGKIIRNITKSHD
jgi:hypothetical protein